MMLNEAAETFLWGLFRLGLLGGDSKRAIEWVATLYDRGLEFPANVEMLLTDYWSSGDRGILLSLALAALKGFCLDVEHRTRMTATLFADGKIDLAQACAFLSFDGANVDDLQPSVRHVADVLWLLRQDLDAQVMEPGQDSLMSDALRKLAKETMATAE